jgi:hypothetical protein
LQILGFNLLSFKEINPKLEKLRDGDKFSGFTPRWQIPTKLRNVTNTDRNTSSILMIIDSKREREIGFAPGFS